uniref:Homing endonuclease LAGLIDADG domain-containing protein n=1 Tax=Ulva intestinalis TaxID=3116 RepID=A0A8F4XN75_ULVIN|nr:hypothetical protein [Ulva intestinalis]
MTTNANEILKSELFEITTGLLLGDGNLQKPKTCKYYRFRFAQNELRQDYVNHLFNKYCYGLKQINNNEKKPLINQLKPRLYRYSTKVNNLLKNSYSFETRISSSFNKHAEIFYSDKSSKKKLCEDITCLYNLITPISLAYWYMDDGSWPNKKAKSLILCTHAYKKEQVEYLSEILNNKFGLKTNLGINKKQPILRISAKSYNILKELIFYTIKEIPSMKSKFPFN